MQKLIFAQLAQAKQNGHTYFSDCSDVYLTNLAIALSWISKVVQPKSFQHFLDYRLELSKTQISKKQCIQALCEINVLSYFAKNYPATFKYEPKLKVGSTKNPEMSYDYDGLTINIEVKCATFDNREKLNKNKLHVLTHVVPNKEAVKADIEFISSLIKKTGTYEGAEEMKNMNNNLKDYLTGANDKFNPDSQLSDINCLIVGCDDPNDIDNWVNYLYGFKGLFKLTDLFDYRAYELVDIVLLTNLYNLYKNPLLTADKDVFNLERTFIVGFLNPRPRIDKRQNLKKWLTSIPNQTVEVCNTSVPGDAPDYIKDTTRISYFVSSNPVYHDFFVNYINPVKNHT